MVVPAMMMTKNLMMVVMMITKDMMVVVMIKNKDILEQGQHHCSLGLALFVWNLERRGIQNNIQFKSKSNIQTSKRPEDATVQLMMKMLTNDKWNEKDKKQKHDKLKIESKEKNLFVSVAIRYFFVNLFFFKLITFTFNS